MVLLESEKIKLGRQMPDFSLLDTQNNLHSLDSSLGSKGLLLVFTCNHCPYAIAVWERLIALAQLAKDQFINTVAINPNIHPDYPQDSPEAMAALVEEKGLQFPYLIDATQEVAKRYDAVCTPDIYLLDSNAKLFYHGRIDDNWQNESAVQHKELEAAIQKLANNEDPPLTQYPSMGCSIKWLS